MKGHFGDTGGCLAWLGDGLDGLKTPWLFLGRLDPNWDELGINRR